MELKTEPKLGEGIFTIPVASDILEIPRELVSRWIKKYWEMDFLRDEQDKYTWGESRDKAFNFYTFVEIITVYSWAIIQKNKEGSRTTNRFNK